MGEMEGGGESGGCRALGRRFAKMLRRGGAGGPELHPFYPLSQLFFVGPLPSSFLTSFFGLLLRSARTQPPPPMLLSPHLAPYNSPPTSLFGVQVKRDGSQRCPMVALWPCSWDVGQLCKAPCSRRVGASHVEQQCVQRCSYQTICAESVCPLVLS